MKLYKYKPLDNFEFVADILINKRLYAASIYELNDPMEGDFTPDTDDEEYNQLIQQEIESLRVCSLAKDMNSIMMWAHYTNGFRGVCIELEFDESVFEPHKVIYGPFNPIPSSNYKGMLGNEEVTTALEWAKYSLLGKYETWAYENEYRILTNEMFIEHGFKITAIYLGTQIAKVYEHTLKCIVDADIDIKYTEVDPLNGVKIKN